MHYRHCSGRVLVSVDDEQQRRLAAAAVSVHASVQQTEQVLESLLEVDAHHRSAVENVGKQQQTSIREPFAEQHDQYR